MKALYKFTLLYCYTTIIFCLFCHCSSVSLISRTLGESIQGLCDVSHVLSFVTELLEKGVLMSTAEDAGVPL